MKIMPVLAIAAAFIWSGCASTGRDFDMDGMSKLHPGVTTEAQADSLLGSQPITRTFRDDGSYLAVWQHIQIVSIIIFPVTTDNKSLYLLFDKNHIYRKMVSMTTSN